MDWKPGMRGIYVEKGESIASLVDTRKTKTMLYCTFRIESHMLLPHIPVGEVFEVSRNLKHEPGLWWFFPMPESLANLLLMDIGRRNGHSCEHPGLDDDFWSSRETENSKAVLDFKARWGSDEKFWLYIPPSLIARLAEQDNTRQEGS